MSTLPNPFLSASDGLHPLSSVAAASGGLPLQNAAAEISSAEPLSAGPAVVPGLSPGSMTTAGTNSAWVRDCDRIELQEIQSSDKASKPSSEVQAGNGRRTCQQANRNGDYMPSGPVARPSEASAVTTPIQGPVAAERLNKTDCINEIFTFARGLMRDYQPDFQALLNEIAPFPMEYLPDYRLGDDDQPLFLQGAVA